MEGKRCRVICGERICCGRGDWRRVGRWDWRIRRAVVQECQVSRALLPVKIVREGGAKPRRTLAQLDFALVWRLVVRVRGQEWWVRGEEGDLREGF